MKQNVSLPYLLVDEGVQHFTSHGGYTVRSGYEVALTLRRNEELGRKAEGESSQGNKQQRIWKSIWGLPVPHKIRTFLWKCCRNVFAVKENLLHRGIDVDTTCTLCGREGNPMYIYFLNVSLHDYFGLLLLYNWIQVMFWERILLSAG